MQAVKGIYKNGKIKTCCINLFSLWNRSFHRLGGCSSRRGTYYTPQERRTRIEFAEYAESGIGTFMLDLSALCGKALKANGLGLRMSSGWVLRNRLCRAIEWLKC